MKKNATPNTEWYMGFAPLIIIFLIAFLSAGLYFYFSKVKQFSMGTTSLVKTANYDGHYESCKFKDACNFIDVKTTNDTFVDGQAFWVDPVPGAVNEGTMAGVLTINSQNASYDNGGCKIDFSFGANQVILKEKQDSVCGGLNVSFDGTYLKK